MAEPVLLFGGRTLQFYFAPHSSCALLVHDFPALMLAPGRIQAGLLPMWTGMGASVIFGCPYSSFLGLRLMILFAAIAGAMAELLAEGPREMRCTTEAVLKCYRSN